MHTGVSLDESDKKFVGRMMPFLDERERRLFIAAYSECLGYGSARELSELTGLSEHTISKAKKELKELGEEEQYRPDPTARPKAGETGSTRKTGAGRHKTEVDDPTVIDDLEKLIDNDTLGIPMTVLKWTTKSTYALSDDLKAMGHNASHDVVGRLLKNDGYSLQQNFKYIESGNPGPDRDAQFKFIAAKAARFIEAGLPVISVDTKKKELVGNYKNNGSEYRKVGNPRRVKDHDFEDAEKGKAVPYGAYDLVNNEGFVSVGVSADTAEFAVSTICSWWYLMGQKRFPEAKELMITADGGGSNGTKVRLWKAELQHFADISGLTVHVCHFPPGTSKWNKIEHRLFSFISRNWRGIPLDSLQIIVDLIGSTTNSSGLKVRCILDEWEYEKGKIVPDWEYESINITRDEWHGEWNYTIAPRP